MRKSGWIHKLAATALVTCTVSVFAGMSAAEDNRETRTFDHARVGYYPYFATCMAERNSRTYDSVCQQFGYQRADSATYFDCIGTYPNWSLAFSGVCSRPRNTSTQ